MCLCNILARTQFSTLCNFSYQCQNSYYRPVSFTLKGHDLMYDTSNYQGGEARISGNRRCLSYVCLHDVFRYTMAYFSRIYSKYSFWPIPNYMISANDLGSLSNDCMYELRGNGGRIDHVSLITSNYTQSWNREVRSFEKSILKSSFTSKEWRNSSRTD
jgi:hypothetical protein